MGLPTFIAHLFFDFIPLKEYLARTGQALFGAENIHANTCLIISSQYAQMCSLVPSPEWKK